MESNNVFDRIVSDKVYRKCIDCGYTKYSEIAVLLDTSDSFVKAVFSARRKKLNLYHLMKLSYELNCSLKELLPNLSDYNKIFNVDNEYEGFLQSINKEEN